MTTVGCKSPSATILLLACLPLLLPLSYYLLDKSWRLQVFNTSHIPSPERIPFSPLDPDGEEEDETQLTIKDKLALVKSNFIFFLMLFIGMFCEYFILQAVITTMAFPDAPFGPRDHYVVYTLVLVIGELVGRSYGLILSCIKSDIDPYTRHTWVLTAFLASDLIFLVFASWFRFLPSVWIILVVAFFVGAVVGALYVNSVATVGKNEASRASREFARAFVLNATSTGILLAALLGLFAEPLLREHCQHVAIETEYCFTRSSSPWNANVTCSLQKLL